MTGVDTALLVLALTLGAAIGARRLRTPMPVVLAAAGIALGAAWRLVPGLPPVTVPADRVLLVFLPPLLTTAAYALPLGAFRRNLRPILLLAVGLVLATMAATAVVAHHLAALPWAVAFVLGAIVAPPDPVAATSVARQTGLPHRLVVILEGEGLVNDAIAIVAYRLAVDAVVTGQFSWAGAALAVAREAPTGVLVGLAIGWAVTRLRRSLDEVTLEAGISLLVPYVAYHVADRVGASGVLAVVTLGFMLRRHATAIGTPAARLAARTIWNAIRFASTALVFLLLGLLVGEIAVAELSASLLLAGAAVAGTVIGLRLLWMFVVPRVTRLFAGERRQPTSSRAELTVLGWAGMRGVVSLALALALPAFPGPGGGAARRAVVLITFAVIVATLVLQGATLLPLVARLGAGDPERERRDERRVRARARRAGLAALARLGQTDASQAGACRLLAPRVNDGTVGIAAAGGTGWPRELSRSVTEVLGAQRAVVERMRDGDRIGETLAERLETELDVDAMSARGAAGRLTEDVGG